MSRVSKSKPRGPPSSWEREAQETLFLRQTRERFKVYLNHTRAREKLVGKVSQSQGRDHFPRGSHSRGERVSSVTRRQGEALVEAVHLVRFQGLNFILSYFIFICVLLIHIHLTTHTSNNQSYISAFSFLSSVLLFLLLNLLLALEKQSFSCACAHIFYFFCPSLLNSSQHA